jgi:hypothetical protein
VHDPRRRVGDWATGAHGRLQRREGGLFDNSHRYPCSCVNVSGATSQREEVEWVRFVVGRGVGVRDAEFWSPSAVRVWSLLVLDVWHF